MFPAVKNIISESLLGEVSICFKYYDGLNGQLRAMSPILMVFLGLPKTNDSTESPVTSPERFYRRSERSISPPLGRDIHTTEPTEFTITGKTMFPDYTKTFQEL